MRFTQSNTVRTSLRGLGVLSLLTFAGAASAQTATLTTLVKFNKINGQYPYAGLALGADGNFYGTTVGGGLLDSGTVFKVSPEGAFESLHSFTILDGRRPESALLLGNDGSLYGTTLTGGKFCYQGTGIGCGSVYSIGTGRSFDSVHSFNSNQGSAPWSGLVKGADGDFYGTTLSGGTNGFGTFYKLSASGKFSELSSLPSPIYSQYTLTPGSDGNFYGVSSQGGCIFRLTPAGGFSIVFSFPETNEDGTPEAGLVQGSDGYLYGTTSNGGTNNMGTVFKVSTSGAYTRLHSFDGTDGGEPVTALMQASDGNFYGSTQAGGVVVYSNGLTGGTIFKMTPDGTLTTLYALQGTDGIAPVSTLVQYSDGSFYGTTGNGGITYPDANANDLGEGTVFKLTVSDMPAPAAHPLRQ